MKLKALDQIHVSAAKSDSLRPGDVFEVPEATGADLLRQHPTKFERLGEPAEKAEPAPKNKAEPAPANKSAPKSGGK